VTTPFAAARVFIQRAEIAPNRILSPAPSFSREPDKTFLCEIIFCADSDKSGLIQLQPDPGGHGIMAPRGPKFHALFAQTALILTRLPFPPNIPAKAPIHGNFLLILICAANTFSRS